MATKKATKASKKPRTKPKRPRDINPLAQFLVRATTERDSEVPEAPAVTKSEVSRVMSELGRRGGIVGGKARAESLTAERKKEIAMKAARARWKKI
jgi:hypothetical protein